MSDLFTVEKLDISAPDKAALINFVESWFDHQYPVLFVGAGLSKYHSRLKPNIPHRSEFSTWQQLLDDFRNRLGGGNKDVSRNLPADPLRLAQVFQVHVGRAQMLDIVSKHVPSDDYEPGPTYRKISSIPWHAVVTTNYDDLLERAFEHNRQVRQIVWDADLTQRRTPGDLPIIKMHGDLRIRDSIILTEEDYRTYERIRPGMAVKIRQLLLEHPLLFVGFSLSDPNATSFDGWIRDAIRETRLPAVALMHGEPFPAEAQMWKERGVHLIVLPKSQTLEHVFEALQHAQQRTVESAEDDFEKNQKIEQQFLELARSYRSDPNWAKRAAELLITLVDSSPVKSRLSGDGGEEIVNKNSITDRCISRFCYGHLLWGDTETRIDHWPIYESFNDDQLKRILQYSLRIGCRFLFLKAPTDKIDAAEILLQKFGQQLTSDEKSRVYFERGKSYRVMNDLTSARDDFETARELATSNELRAVISIDLREVLFADGDVERLEREMTRAPDTQDAFALCRRGSDALLLQREGEAHGYYRQALDRARTEDERYVALWGLQASLWPQYPHGQHSTIERFRTEALAIRAETRPLTEAIWNLRQQAGEQCLTGDYSAAIRLLQDFLDRARRIGWPLTTRHRVRFPIELAATQAAGLLLLAKTDDDQPVERDDVKKALSLLVQFGLGAEVEKLLTEESVLRFSENEIDQKWYQYFVCRRTKIPKQDEVRQICATVGIPLLDDSQIDQTVLSIVNATGDFIRSKNTDEKHPELLRDYWRSLTHHAEHLPEDSILGVLSVLPLGWGRPAPSICSEMGSWPWKTWKLCGVLSERKVDSVLKKIVAGIVKAIGEVYIRKDWIWRKHIFSLCSDLHSEKLLGIEPRRKIVEKLRALSITAEKTSNNRILDELDAINLLYHLEPTDAALEKGAATALSLYPNVANSTTLPFWLSIMSNICNHLDGKQLNVLVDIAKTRIDSELKTSNANWPSAPASTAYLLEKLATNRVSAKRLGGISDIADAIEKLGTIDPSALSTLYGFDDLVGSDHIKRAEWIIHNSLVPASSLKRKRQALTAIHFGLQKGKQISPIANQIMREVIRLFSAEDPQIRINASYVISQAPKQHRAPFEQEACELILSQLLCDPNWRVRAASLSHLGTMCKGTELNEPAMNEASRLLTDPIAAVRRYAGMAIKDLE